MAELRSGYSDQSLVRAIRKAVIRFKSAHDDDLNAKLKALMTVSALGAVAGVSNPHMVVSTVSFIEGALS